MAKRFRKAGEEFALERGYNVAESVYAGVCAEVLHRWRTGDTQAATICGTQLEVLCGDPLASRSAAEVGVIQSLRFMDWLNTNMDELASRADGINLSSWLYRPAAYGYVAMQLVSATSVSTAAMLYTRAVATIRSGRNDIDPCDQAAINAVVMRLGDCDPLLAAASRRMSDVDRSVQQFWVQANWNEIQSVGADFMLVEDNAARTVSFKQCEAMARHEVRAWLNTFDVLIGDDVSAYAEAVAVGLLYCPSGGAQAQDAIMRIVARADDTVIAINAEETLRDEVRTQIR